MFFNTFIDAFAAKGPEPRSKFLKDSGMIFELAGARKKQMNLSFFRLSC